MFYCRSEGLNFGLGYNLVETSTSSLNCCIFLQLRQNLLQSSLHFESFFKVMATDGAPLVSLSRSVPRLTCSRRNSAVPLLKSSDQGTEVLGSTPSHPKLIPDISFLSAVEPELSPTPMQWRLHQSNPVCCIVAYDFLNCCCLSVILCTSSFKFLPRLFKCSRGVRFPGGVALKCRLSYGGRNISQVIRSLRDSTPWKALT